MSEKKHNDLKKPKKGLIYKPPFDDGCSYGSNFRQYMNESQRASIGSLSKENPNVFAMDDPLSYILDCKETNICIPESDVVSQMTPEN